MLVTSIMYTGYKITSFIVSGIKPKDYAYHVTGVYNFKNWLFLVYVSNKNLRYIIHSGYEHHDSGTVWRGIASMRENKVKITHRGKYGIRLTWNDAHGRAHKGTIDLWHGFYTGRAKARTKRPIMNVGKKSAAKVRLKELKTIERMLKLVAARCQGCREPNPLPPGQRLCTLPDDAEGYRTAYETHQNTHPGDENCAVCDQHLRDLYQTYTAIANCRYR